VGVRVPALGVVLTRDSEHVTAIARFRGFSGPRRMVVSNDLCWQAIPLPLRMHILKTVALG